MSSPPEVSVIIPTRDSVVDLRRCLASLNDGQGTSFEVLVVDQESADGTRDAAVGAGVKLLNVSRPKRYVPPNHSRNLAAAEAHGTYLLHLDADMTLASGVLREAVRACRENGHVALTLEEVDVTEGFWADCKALERLTYRESNILEAARFVRADVFRKVGGYDEKIGSAEDWDIHSRYAAQGSTGRIPEAVFHHLGALSLTAQLRKKFAYGRSMLGFIEKHNSSKFSGAIASAYVRSWRIFARDPVHAFGFTILRLGETVALAAGVGLESLERRRINAEGNTSSNVEQLAAADRR